jgi:hypothetical protein
MFPFESRFLKSLAIVLMFVTWIPCAQADDEDEGGRRAVVSNAKWQAECGSCHVAFPARMLPAESWRAMMSGLDKHFGTDASLEPQVAEEITAFLVQHASKRKSDPAAKPLLRISEMRWFVREHRRVSEGTWKLVKSPANCAACHTKAESGRFGEHDIRMPK